MRQNASLGKREREGEARLDTQDHYLPSQDKRRTSQNTAHETRAGVSLVEEEGAVGVLLDIFSAGNLAANMATTTTTTNTGKGRSTKTASKSKAKPLPLPLCRSSLWTALKKDCFVAFTSKNSGGVGCV